MKTHKVFWAGMLVVGLMFGLTLTTGQAMADEPTMQQIIDQMAVQLGMTSDRLTTILFPTGVTGLDRPATADNIAQLYLAVNNAITAGTITGNASSIVSNAANSTHVTTGITQTGISTGTTIATAGGTGSGGGAGGGAGGGGAGGGAGGGGAGGGAGGGGGGGGVVFSKSR